MVTSTSVTGGGRCCPHKRRSAGGGDHPQGVIKDAWIRSKKGVRPGMKGERLPEVG